jgi:aspartokinase
VKKIFAAHLEELEQLLKGIAMMKELTLRTKDYLVSFGECMSTRIFAAYLNKIGVKARQVCCFLITCLFFNVISLPVFSNDWYMNLISPLKKMVRLGFVLSSTLLKAILDKSYLYPPPLILQYDAFEIGFITTDDFTNADILEATYPAVAKKLIGDWVYEPAIPIVTGFLGKVFLLASIQRT